MIKRLIVSGAVVSAVALAGPAIAGPYVNVENNAGFTGSDFNGSVTDAHVGYEGGDGVYGFYLQGGPAYVQPDGDDGEFELSGKIGGSVQATEQFGAYGEISFMTGDDDVSYGTKVGVKYNF
ncbi:gp222 [uncultured phage MedDCM-OCT-S01-C29]|nr:gp222 [uncultured phage MedDCM-OCT-S01-C29]BAR22676.1 DUF680 domain-containing protein [uncultured Mediterranean phage uvMED]